VGSERAEAEPEAVDEIVDRCARLPLALAVAAARAATSPHLPLAKLAQELRDNHDRLDTLAGHDPDTDVRDVFSWSYRTLDPAAARLFRLLGLHPGPDISLPAAASLAALPERRLRPAMATLLRAHLIVEPTAGRYTFHDLLRAYAAEQVAATEPEADRDEATQRLFDHYLHTAYWADRLLDPTRETIDLPPPPAGCEPERLPDDASAREWFVTELPAVLAAFDQAVAAGRDDNVWRLAWTIVPVLDRRGDWATSLAVHSAGLAAATRLGLAPAQAAAHRALALAHTKLGRFDQAHRHLRQALDLYEGVGETDGQGNTHLNLTWVCEREGRLEAGLDHARAALDLYRKAGDRDGEAAALNTTGWFPPCSATTSRPSSTVDRPCRSTRSAATSGGRPTPGTASATPTTISGTTARRSPASSGPWPCSAVSATASSRRPS
jgi:tetratricopeptide (TPR) repeat protein